MNFQLDERLRADTLSQSVDLPLCELRCFDDFRFPWVVLVPRLPNIVEIMDLEKENYLRLTEEIHSVSDALKEVTSCDKINIAAFGNMVPQLHIHIVARTKDDPAWPGSAVGFEGKERYPDGRTPEFFQVLVQKLSSRV